MTRSFARSSSPSPRALWRRAEGGKTEEARAAAAKRLAEFATVWNRDEGIPKAPKPRESGAPDFDAWRKWYARMVRFPGK